MIASTGPVGWHCRSQVEGPGVVIGRSGSIGGGQFVNGDFWPLNTTLWVSNFKGNSRRFCYYLLRSFDFKQFNVGSGVPTLNRNHLHPLPVRVPGRPEQERIAGLLGVLDDKIELNQRINETLEAMAQAIFRDWFIDFGPVRRKMEGATDFVAIMGGLVPYPAYAAELAGLFPAALGENGLPEGWSERSLASQMDIIGGGTPKTSEPGFWGGEIPWFSVTDTPSGSNTFVIKTEKTITNEGVAGSSARVVPAGTTIISARGTVGNLAIAAAPMTFNQSCYGLKSSRGEHPYFVFLAAQRAVSQLRDMAHGSVFSTITRQTFDALPVAAAPIVLIDALELVVGPLFARLRAAVIENSTLAETRDYLLPRLMSGAVRVVDDVALAS